jgi:DNA repair ATPase RecN
MTALFEICHEKYSKQGNFTQEKLLNIDKRIHNQKKKTKLYGNSLREVQQKRTRMNEAPERVDVVVRSHLLFSLYFSVCT